MKSSVNSQVASGAHTLTADIRQYTLPHTNTRCINIDIED